ncbi:MAG TPA: PKD domain-containing protein, partial [Thermoplasmatales archaeon]|nr:PKD domain-containing protein [Thermoplasmatales archaeon]
TSGGNNNGGNNNLPPPPPPMNQPPVANAGDPYSGILGVPAEFDASASHDPDGNITGYRWDFDGDGSWDTEWLKTPIATHNYTSTGFYTIILEVKDNQGATDTDSTSAIIEESFNYPPTTPVISGPSTGYANTSYNFTAVSTDNDSATLQYTFNWGDGETTTTEFVPNGTAVHLNHTWHVPGNYTIQVMAYDNNTVSGTATHYVEITVTSDEEPTNNSGSVTSQDYTVYYVAVILIILLILIFLLGRKKKKT